MNAFFQSAIANSPVLLAITILFIMIVVQGIKTKSEFRILRGEMREGFKNVDNEFKLVRSEMKEGFLKVKHTLNLHDNRFKQIEKKLKHKRHPR